MPAAQPNALTSGDPIDMAGEKRCLMALLGLCGQVYR
jgi:hypothetical protein